MPWKRMKGRVHNEWMRPVSRGNRKSCSNCHEKLEPGEWIWSCGAYVRGKWRTQFDCCKKCWPRWAEELVAHESDCPENCTVVLVPYHCVLPEWMTLTRKEGACSQTYCPPIPTPRSASSTSS